jgi:hypothetical protein
MRASKWLLKIHQSDGNGQIENTVKFYNAPTSYLCVSGGKEQGISRMPKPPMLVVIAISPSAPVRRLDPQVASARKLAQGLLE